MNTRYIIALLVFGLGAITFRPHAHAQATSILVGQVNHEGDDQVCVTVKLEPEAKQVAGAWQKYLKKEHSIKLKGKRPMRAEEVNFGAISNQTLDFFSEVAEEDGMSVMKVYARLGYDDYLSPNEHPEAFAAMKSVTVRFVREYLQGYYAHQIDVAAKALAKTRKLRGKYQKESEGLRSANEDLTSEMKKLERKIESNEGRVDGLKELIETSDKTINSQEGTLSRLREKYSSIPNQ